MKFWTDYPIEELGDTPGMLAPIRQVTLLSYDGDKYVKVEVAGIKTEFKSGYLYTEAGRFHYVPGCRELLKEFEI